MSNVLSKLEQVKAKLMYAVLVGHDFIPVSKLMFIINKISRILGHYRPLSYQHPSPQEPPERKVYDALDDAHRELFDLLHTRSNEVVEKIGAKEAEDLNNLMADISHAKDRAFDKERGPGSSLLKRGRRFSIQRLSL